MNKNKGIAQQRAYIGTAIKTYRTFQNLSQETVAERAGIRKATLIDLELGRPVNIDTLLSVLGCLKGTIKISW